MLSLVGFHLGNEVDKMFWLFEELELFGIDKIAEFVLNLNDELNNIKRIKSVIAEVALEGDGSLLGSSEIVLEDTEDILLNLVIALENERVVLLGFDILPEGNLIGGLVFSWDEVDVGVEVEVTLEASHLGTDEGSSKVLSISTSAEADMVSWLDHFGHSWGSRSNKTSSHDS